MYSPFKKNAIIAILSVIVALYSVTEYHGKIQGEKSFLTFVICFIKFSSIAKNSFASSSFSKKSVKLSFPLFIFFEIW